MVKDARFSSFLSFNDTAISFNSGLVVFTGISGSGKSILLNALLSTFGFCDSDVPNVEVSICRDINLNNYGINIDSNVFIIKRIKNDNTRYYVDNQGTNKKVMSQIGSSFIHYLSDKDYKDFSSDKLIDIIDMAVIKKQDNTHKQSILEYKKEYYLYVDKEKELQIAKENIKESIDKKDFLEFEINKIESLSLKEGDEERLLNLKKDLSLKEKSLEAISSASSIFNFENEVITALNIMDKDSSFFTETMDELKSKFSLFEDKFNDMEEMDIESLLDKIEGVSEIVRKYGSIANALNELEIKKNQLSRINTADEDIIKLTKDLALLKESLIVKAKSINEVRVKFLDDVNTNANRYSNLLSIDEVRISLKLSSLNDKGGDEATLYLRDMNDMKTFSKGEVNRLRLVLIALSCNYSSEVGGVIFLDEIDANLSGEEAMKIAIVLKEIKDSKYQIFSISHQPQLTSIADQHYLVYKDNNRSNIKELNYHDRIEEIARMVSGNKITPEAIDYAVRMLSEDKK